MPIPRSRNGSVRARHEHQKAIGCRVVVPPHSRKQEKKKRKKIEREVLFDDPPCRSTRAPERLRSQRACFLETWMRRTFLKSRESRVLVFSRIPEKKENAQKKKGRKRDGETKKKDKIIKKAGRKLPPLFCLFVCLESSPSKREFCLSRRRRRRSKKKETKFFVSSRKQTSHHFFLYQKKPPTREDRPFKSASFLPRFLPL